MMAAATLPIAVWSLSKPKTLWPSWFEPRTISLSRFCSRPFLQLGDSLSRFCSRPILPSIEKRRQPCVCWSRSGFDSRGVHVYTCVCVCFKVAFRFCACYCPRVDKSCISPRLAFRGLTPVPPLITDRDGWYDTDIMMGGEQERQLWGGDNSQC
jgi:hypothetical protein